VFETLNIKFAFITSYTFVNNKVIHDTSQPLVLYLFDIINGYHTIPYIKAKNIYMQLSWNKSPWPNSI